jgi:hypothetical protein
MIKEVLEENIYYYKNAVADAEALKKAIDDSENYDDISEVVPKWNEWSSCSGQMYVYGDKKNIFEEPIDKLSPEMRSKADYIINTVRDAMNAALEDFAKSKNINEPVSLSKFLGINRYKEGTYMGGHYDQQEGDFRLKYSLILYVNDDYEGGEISFTIKDGVLEGEDKPKEDFADLANDEKISVSIKPEAGSILIFPSSPPYSHTAHLIKKGYKYMIPGFWMNESNQEKDQ